MENLDDINEAIDIKSHADSDMLIQTGLTFSTLFLYLSAVCNLVRLVDPPRVVSVMN